MSNPFYFRRFIPSMVLVPYVSATVVPLLTEITMSIMGVSDVVSICLSVLLAVILLTTAITLHRKIERRRVMALERISEVCHAIVEGSPHVRLNDDAIKSVSYLQDFRPVYSAVNLLAEKPAKDLREMERLMKVRSEFLANVSHELRTPIFSVQGFLETLLDGALEDSDVRRQFVEKAFANTQRLNILLSDLIDISRIESGEMRLSFRFFDIVPLVQETVRALEPKAEARGITLEIVAPSGNELVVYGDRDRLTQVLTNLIDNAIKYNVDGGRVTVTMQKIHRREGLVSVRDTGIGIAPEHHNRVFERFYRVDKGRSRAVGGTGLGLAIVKHILEAHKSVISLESYPGKGTTVSFTLTIEE